MAFPLSGHFQELLWNQRSHFLLRGLAVACDRLGDQSRQKLPAQADLAHRDCVEKVIDDVLMALVHEGNGCGHGVWFADEELVAGKADPSGVLARVAEHTTFDLGVEGVTNRVWNRDGFLGGAGHRGRVVKIG